MPPRTDRLAALLVALIAGLADPPYPGAEPGPGSFAPTGTVRLTSGVTAQYAYHYDRNAMADALLVGDALVALTDVGTLLRFDRATLELTKEWFGPSAATCLGRGADNALLAGFVDGRIVRVNPADLTVTEIARAPGKVQWVGSVTSGAGQAARPRLVAVVEQKKPYRNDDGRTYEAPVSIVHDLGSGKTYPVDPSGKVFIRATAFLLDRKHRLWLGADRGEWGGWCSYVDLDAGQVHPVPGLRIFDFSPQPFWLGVVGFTELKDGQIWAYGGTTHMGQTDGFIWRVDRGKAEDLYRLDNEPPNLREYRKKKRAEAERIEKEKARQRRDFAIPPERDDNAPEPEPDPEPKPDPLPTDRPYLPITHVLEDLATGSIRVVAFSGIYRTDAKLARWEKVHELKIQYRWGRRDSVGAYPSVRSVLPIEEPGRPTSLLFATRLDGLIRLDEGRQTDRTLTGQLGVGSIERIANSSEGLLVLGDPSDGDTWRYRDGAWNPASFAPPFERAGPNEPIEDPPPDDWHQSLALVGRDGSIVTINASASIPGSRTTARWRNGKAEVLGREVSDLIPPACFLTPDGGLWNADDGVLQRLADGRWSTVVGIAMPPREVGRPGWSGIGRGLRAVHDAGPPWILHDPINEMVLRLTYDPGFKDPQMEAIPLAEAGRPEPLKVRAAIPWSKGELLLATDRGLRTVAIDGGRLAVPALETGGRSVSRLARDGRGRLWLGGEGLAVLDADGKTLHPLDALPMLGRSKIEALAADPAHPDGAVAAVEGRGVVFVRVERPR